MSELYELRIIEFESARNDAMDKYFNARPQLPRTGMQEAMFEAGFRMAWEANNPDALRYRWLREKAGLSSRFVLHHRREPHEWDAEIDAEMTHNA